MKAIKICICLKNRKYTQDLSKAMSRRSSRLDISCISCDEHTELKSLAEKYDVLLCDAEIMHEYEPKLLLIEGSSKITCHEDYRKNGRVMSSLNPVSRILQRVTEIYEEESGDSFFTADESSPCKVLIYTDMGGSGVTAAALTMGRLIACESDKRVLYAGLGGTRSRDWYLSELKEAARAADELRCMVRSGVPFSIESYISKDRYGLNIFKGSGSLREDEEALAAIAEKKAFDVIIADMPQGTSRLGFEKIFCVINEKDARRSAPQLPPKASDSEGIRICTILNRSYGNRIEGDTVHVADDPASFELTRTGIEIALDKAFAEGIRKLLHMISPDEGERKWIDGLL